MGFFKKKLKKYDSEIYRVDKQGIYDLIKTISQVPFILGKLIFFDRRLAPNVTSITFKYSGNEELYKSEFYSENAYKYEEAYKNNVINENKKIIITEKDIVTETEISLKKIVDCKIFEKFFVELDFDLYHKLQNSASLSNKGNTLTKRFFDLEERSFLPFMNEDLNVFKNIGLNVFELYFQWHNGYIAVDDNQFLIQNVITEKYQNHLFKTLSSSEDRTEFEKIYSPEKRQALVDLFEELKKFKKER